MKKLLLLIMLVLTLSACNESVRRTLPSMKGHFKGYGSVYKSNGSDGTSEYIGYFPVYRKGDNLKIYVDEEEETSYTLQKLSSPIKLSETSEEFGYVYGGCYYVSKRISY